MFQVRVRLLVFTYSGIIGFGKKIRLSSRESAARRVHLQYSTSLSESVNVELDNVRVEIFCGQGEGVTWTMSKSDNF